VVAIVSLFSIPPKPIPCSKYEYRPQRRVYPEELKKAFPRAGIVSRLMLY
jgi:hypothetical protein